MKGVTVKLRPTNLKGLGSFLGAINQFNRFVTDLAPICFQFRSNLKRDATWNWSTDYEKAFQNVNEEVRKVAELVHFKLNELLGN